MVKHTILPFPDATVGELLGLCEVVYSYGGTIKISFLADELRMNIDDLGDVIDTGELLGLLKVRKGEIHLTLFGEALSLGNIDDKKKIIRERLVKVEPFKTAYKLLKKAKVMEDEDLLNALKKKFVIEDETKFFKLLVGWASYAELFEHDSDEGIFYLSQQETEKR